MARSWLRRLILGRAGHRDLATIERRRRVRRTLAPTPWVRP